MAPLTAFQSRRTGGVTFVAPSGGETSCGGVVAQFWLFLIENLATFERVPGHSSKAASTNQATLPGGRRLVAEVSPVFSMSWNAPPSSDANTRYSSAFSTALQTSVTGELMFAAPSAGATSAGASPPQFVLPVLT